MKKKKKSAKQQCIICEIEDWYRHERQKDVRHDDIIKLYLYKQRVRYQTNEQKKNHEKKAKSFELKKFIFIPLAVSTNILCTHTRTI